MSILKEELLNFASLEGNNNKFYRIQLFDLGPDQYDVYAEYGRLGSVNPQSTRKSFSDIEAADKHYEKTLKSKIKKGYHVLITADHLDNDGLTDPNLLTDEVLKLINRLYDYSKSYVTKSITTPLGNLSSKQVSKGREVLKQIEILLDKKDSSLDFLPLSNDFYAVIPYVFGYRVDIKRMVIDSYEKLNERLELLDVMESLVNSNLNSDISDQYKALGVELKHLDVSDSKYVNLLGGIKSSHSSSHRFPILVENIYEVEYMKNPPEFNPLNVEVCELYHGSRSENIVHILQQGLKIKPPSAVHTGSMFGNGIYFADQSSKSANYCWGFGSKDRNRNYYLLVCEVAVGKIKDYDGAQSNLSSAPWGYNSVRGVKGRSLVHNEIIVYKESQARIKYIIEFKSK